jgi:hypothetical protein
MSLHFKTRRVREVDVGSSLVEDALHENDVWVGRSHQEFLFTLLGLGTHALGKELGTRDGHDGARFGKVGFDRRAVGSGRWDVRRERTLTVLTPGLVLLGIFSVAMLRLLPFGRRLLF